MRGGRATAGLMWLPPAATAVLVWLVYDTVHDEELGSRAGAEPVLAGLLVSSPFIFLMCFELAGAALTGVVETYAGRTSCLVATTLVAAAVLASVLWFLRHDPDSGLTGVLVALTLFPLAPAWVAHARDPAAP